MPTKSHVALAMLGAAVAACSQQAPAAKDAGADQAAAAAPAPTEAELSGANVIAQQDTNRDGAISRAEYMAMTEAMWTKTDVDGDGRLTGAERRNYHGKPGPEQTREEFLKTSLGMFESEDTNKDGTIAGDEVGRFRDHIDGGSKPLPAKAG